MPNPPHRPFFQIHLSTAVVLMFTAGALIWANTCTERIGEELNLGGFDRGKLVFNPSGIYSREKYGWPFHLRTDYIRINSNITETAFALIFSQSELSYTRLALNCIIAFFALASVWFLCEWLIRRRAARKGA